MIEPLPSRTRASIAAVPVLALACALALACTESPAPAPDPIDSPASPAPTREKIPVTTRSDDARELYLEGRRLFDRIRPTEARQLYLEALSLDRHFALAHLAVANSATSAREFFESMARAVALSDVVSEGERLMILAQDAQIRGAPQEQLEMLQRLVALYPEDERAHLQLGNSEAAAQNYERAIEHYERAARIAPDFSPAYNSLGYTYRALDRFDDAEVAFRRYIELLPEEPNPYDSFAELLMKTGRFEESIEQYRKALAIEPDFSFSYIGLAHDLVLLGRYEEARATLHELDAIARDVGQRRTALSWEVLSYVHQGDAARALAVTDRLLALAEENDDPAGMAGDLVLRGRILLHDDRTAEAEEMFVEAVQRMARADVPTEVMEANRRSFLYWKARLALATGRLEDAARELASYREVVAVHSLDAEERRVHELVGELALLDGKAQEALAELEQANERDPRVLLLTARALQAGGDPEAALEFAARAAHFNELSVSYAFVRALARRLVAELQAATGAPGDPSRAASTTG